MEKAAAARAAALHVVPHCTRSKKRARQGVGGLAARPLGLIMGVCQIMGSRRRRNQSSRVAH
eukprot:5984371-Prymnesium_polylepis.1